MIRSSAPPGPWTYLDLARDLRAVADLTGATRALGVSLGAGALVRLLADNPSRFERVVIFLPASLVAPSPDAGERFEALLPIIVREGGDNRNFVRKAVNWALRQIGKRNRALNAKAITAAEELRATNTKSGRWIAADALRELKSEAVQARLT